MSILVQLQQNKGTVSSALGKQLAQQVLNGDLEILDEAVALLAYDDKNVRAGAAKIVEQVAVARPALVVGYLPRLLPALDVPEPQTRWMVIHTLGVCAALDTETAARALPQAAAFIEQDSGACLWGATIQYLGHLGAMLPDHARAVYPLLEQALRTIPRQAKNVLQSFLWLSDQADGATRVAIARHAGVYLQDESNAVRQMAAKVQRKADNVRGVM